MSIKCFQTCAPRTYSTILDWLNSSNFRHHRLSRFVQFIHHSLVSMCVCALCIVHVVGHVQIGKSFSVFFLLVFVWWNYYFFRIGMYVCVSVFHRLASDSKHCTIFINSLHFINTQRHRGFFSILFACATYNATTRSSLNCRLPVEFTTVNIIAASARSPLVLVQKQNRCTGAFGIRSLAVRWRRRRLVRMQSLSYRSLWGDFLL